MEGSGVPLEQTLHLGWIFQMPIRIALQPVARSVDRAALPDAGDHILQPAPIRMVIEDVTECDGWNAGDPGGFLDLMQTQVFVLREPADQGHIGAISEGGFEARQVGFECVVRFVAKEDR